MPENQQRLRHLQWRIDMERARAKNPVDAMIRLNKMMWNQFYAKDGFVVAVNMLQDAGQKLVCLTNPKTTYVEAKIISFKKIE